MNLGKRATHYRTIDGVDHKRCPRCSAFFPATSQFFYARKGKLHSYCRPCQITAVMVSAARRAIEAAGIAAVAA